MGRDQRSEKREFGGKILTFSERENKRFTSQESREQQQQQHFTWKDKCLACLFPFTAKMKMLLTTITRRPRRDEHTAFTTSAAEGVAGCWNTELQQEKFVTSGTVSFATMLLNLNLASPFQVRDDVDTPLLCLTVHRDAPTHVLAHRFLLSSMFVLFPDWRGEGESPGPCSVVARSSSSGRECSVLCRDA